MELEPSHILLAKKSEALVCGLSNSVFTSRWEVGGSQWFLSPKLFGKQHLYGAYV